MSQGLFTASTGIAANQAKIDVIADNIANINTVGFKSSQLNFETVFSRSLGSGSSPTDDLGGINPKEVGLGVTVGEIGRNFRNGSIQNTGRTTDLNIQGEGFFSLMNYDGSIFLSRAGNFTTDSNGFLVNPQGLKVLGTSTATSNTASTTPVQIPTKLNLVVPDAVGIDTITNLGTGSSSTVTAGTFTVNIDGTDVSTTINAGDSLAAVVTELNTNIQAQDPNVTATLGGTNNNQIIIDGANGEIVTFSGASGDTSNFLGIMGFAQPAITAGTFTFDVAGNGATVTIADGDSLSDIATKIDAAIAASGGDPNSTITVSVNGNQLQIDTTTDSEVIDNFAGTSNFSTVAGIGGAAATGYYTTIESQSSALKDQSQITIADSDDSGDTYSVTTFSISQDGALEATYSNGAKLSVATNSANGSKELKYTTAGGNIISNSNITNSHASLTPAQMQIQLATVINPKGLNSAGGNLFALNSIAGEPTYAIGRSGGLGVINSGALEASNVDLPSEFANMILAQRGIEANSRTFSVQDQIMRAIVNLGRG